MLEGLLPQHCGSNPILALSHLGKSPAAAVWLREKQSGQRFPNIPHGQMYHAIWALGCSLLKEIHTLYFLLSGHLCKKHSYQAS